ncbi:ZYBA0S08-00716g1_1 [Zygosaccharomyces bailii CLIB 213]|uniref:Pre-mRNA-splicing factor CEF1 n=1 Tax=Zygosaccharomyces bailii (strain CLIB 213 / ATCC 58445 / CBS 680 / BCRC 21525 / NBRC 1098 / NCYC 1416 / NRRL Y-2227) TaxID=1333698 RepID=A0A8J2T9H2_ZYGB2|nr:ZYBA0S08-00716g1_1 [Zygosaccharomyces bailii CLIB 213]
MAPIPVYVKGGVWTNLEDQIVKAAIQKYGTHQWSKVASLLQKKSAKQCQIRWNEYLNPRLNFDDFSKEEDAKLLELARKLPNQWRSISDIMGRTSQICIERYNKLLEGDDLGVSSSLEFKVDDVNPNAETQVAKPDGREMDDEEREMLVEARARLLNTQGKKATRKVRQRMLEESKRIAQLQKRRELKQAGVRTDIKKPRKRYSTEIDYNEDIAYEQQPQPGVYDTSLEDQRMAASIEMFEENVALRGLRERKEDGRVKKKRTLESAAFVHPPQATTDDFKKPKLQLSEPGAKNNADEIIQENKYVLMDVREPEIRKIDSDSSTLISLRQKLANMFAALPPPKNEFEILLDDELEYERPKVPEDLREKTAQATQQQRDVTSSIQILELECLSKSAPEFIEYPKNDIEQKYNELVALSSTQQPYTHSDNMQVFLDQVELRMQEVSVHEKHTQWEFPPANVIAQSIDEQLKIIEGLQCSLKFVQPLVHYNQQLCNKLCSDQLPLLRRLQQQYYVGYQMYLQEQQAIETMKSKLSDDLKGAIGTAI